MNTDKIPTEAAIEQRYPENEMVYRVRKEPHRRRLSTAPLKARDLEALRKADEKRARRLVRNRNRK